MTSFYTVDDVTSYLNTNKLSFPIDHLSTNLLQQGCPKDIIIEALARVSGFTVDGVISHLNMYAHQYPVHVLRDQLSKDGCPKFIIDQAFLSQDLSAIQTVESQKLLSQIHLYQILSGIFWIVLGCIQCATICAFYIPGPIIGIWNIVNGAMRVNQAPRILARDRNIPMQYESINMLVAVAVANVLIGGVIGILFVILDFVIRDKILKNRHLFTA